MSRERIHPLVACLVVSYCLCFMLTQLLMTVPGGRVPFYGALLCLFAIPTVHEKRSVRITSLVLVFVSSFLLLWDHYAGLAFEKALQKILHHN